VFAAGDVVVVVMIGDVAGVIKVNVGLVLVLLAGTTDVTTGGIVDDNGDVNGDVVVVRIIGGVNGDVVVVWIIGDVDVGVVLVVVIIVDITIGGTEVVAEICGKVRGGSVMHRVLNS